MTPKYQETGSNGPKVPAYIVTFSDMVTLLLTFFVMLLSLSSVQDPELFNISRDAFMERIQFTGLGIFSGKKMKPDFGERKTKYFIENPDETVDVRTIDAREEDIRRVFKKISQSMTTMPSQIVAQRTNFSITNISFSPGDVVINESAKRFLTQFAMDLQQNSGQNRPKLCVLGLAVDQKTEKDQWILSARRAQAVSDFLTNILPSKWPVYSWGAGPGGDWADQDSPISKQSQILIAVLRPNK